MSPLIIILLALGAIVGIAMLIVRRAMRRMENETSSTALPAAQSAPVPAPAVNQQREPTGSYAKRCPTCRSIYADETLAFCLSDGSTLELVSDAPAPLHHDPNATALYPGAQSNDISPTVQYQPGLTTDKKE